MANGNNSKVLEKTTEPVTITEIVLHFAAITGMHPREVAEYIVDVLNETLERGTRFGYMQRRNRRNFSVPTEPAIAVQSADDEHLEDRTRRRRRGRGRTQSADDDHDLEDRWRRRRRGRGRTLRRRSRRRSRR